MGNLSPVAILYDEDGHPIKVTLDGTEYKLEVLTKIKDADDTVINPATEDGNLATIAEIDFATETTLDAIKDTDGIKKITDALPAGDNNIGNVDLASAIPVGTNEIGKVAQGTKAEGSGAWPTVLYDATGNAVAVTLDGSIYRLQTYSKLLAANTPDDIVGTIKIGNGTYIADVNSGKRLLVTSVFEEGSNVVGKFRLVDHEGDEAEILSDGRLMVSATISSSGAGVLYQDLLYSNSRDMNVNGSVTPQVFYWYPGAAYDIEGISLNLVIEEPTIAFGNSFFGITTLGNGMLIEAKASDRLYTIANFKRTREVVQYTTSGGFDLYDKTPDLCKVLIGLGGIKFKKSGTYVNPDYLRITIRDNLTALDHASAVFCGKEMLE